LGWDPREAVTSAPDAVGAESGVEADARTILDQLAAAVGDGNETVAAYYRLASDRMRGSLGGSEHFGRALGNDRYSPLLTASSAELTSVELAGESARGLLTVTTPAGAAIFELAVARARFGERKGQWCLSGVARAGVDL